MTIDSNKRLKDILANDADRIARRAEAERARTDGVAVEMQKSDLARRQWHEKTIPALQNAVVQANELLESGGRNLITITITGDALKYVHLLSDTNGRTQHVQSSIVIRKDTVVMTLARLQRGKRSAEHDDDRVYDMTTFDAADTVADFVEACIEAEIAGGHG